MSDLFILIYSGGGCVKFMKKIKDGIWIYLGVGGMKFMKH